MVGLGWAARVKLGFIPVSPFFLLYLLEQTHLSGGHQTPMQARTGLTVTLRSQV